MINSWNSKSFLTISRISPSIHHVILMSPSNMLSVTPLLRCVVSRCQTPISPRAAGLSWSLLRTVWVETTSRGAQKPIFRAAAFLSGFLRAEIRGTRQLPRYPSGGQNAASRRQFPYLCTSSVSERHLMENSIDESPSSHKVTMQ